MTEIERKALALVNKVEAERNWPISERLHRGVYSFDEALCRAIEQHEAFRQEVSEFALGVKGYMASVKAMAWQSDCDEFILPKPKTDPLEKALEEAGYAVFPDDLKRLRAAIETRGGRIVWEGE